MNSLKDLTAEPRFRERKRGYDCDEVNHYVQTVTKTAVGALQQFAVMQRRLEQGEGASTASVDEASESMVRTLVLAQKTADAAVADAKERAQALTDEAQERADAIAEEAASSASSRLESAREEAAQLLAEAEQSSGKIISEAKRTAEAEVAMERQNATQEIDGLRAEIAKLDAARAAVQSRLEDERARMRDHMAAFASFMESVESGRHEEVVTEAFSEVEPVEAAAKAAADAAASLDDSPVETVVAHDQSADHAEHAEAPAPAPEPAEQHSAFDDTVTDLPAVKWMDDTTAQSDIVDLPNALPPTELMPAVSVETPGLFDTHGDEEEEFVDQLRRVVHSDSPAVASDEAMSAFFDQSDDEAGRRQPGRRSQPMGQGKGRGAVSPQS